MRNPSGSVVSDLRREMNFLPENLVTGNDVIDSEHSTLLDYLDRAKNSDLENCREIFYELLHYLTEHFIHEEDLMESTHYTKIGDHKEEHYRLQELYLSLVRPILREEKESQEIIIFLNRLVEHIQTFDKDLAESLRILG